MLRETGIESLQEERDQNMIIRMRDHKRSRDVLRLYYWFIDNSCNKKSEDLFFFFNLSEQRKTMSGEMIAKQKKQETHALGQIILT